MSSIQSFFSPMIWCECVDHPHIVSTSGGERCDTGVVSSGPLDRKVDTRRVGPSPENKSFKLSCKLLRGVS